MRRCSYILFVFILINLFGSCSKKVEGPTGEEIVSPDDNSFDKSDESYLKDSTLYYTKLLSLWQDYIIPRNVNDILDSIKVRSITKGYSKAEDVLGYLVSLTPMDPTSNKPIDRFSFIDREGSVSDEIQNAVATSYGMYVFYLQTEEARLDNDNAYLYVRMVDVNSPAYVAGIRRGDRILSINGNSRFDYNTQKAQNFAGINSALSSSSMKVKWRNPQSKDFEKDFISSLYSFNPILNSKVFDTNSGKVGYLAFSSFVNIVNNGVLTKMHTDFENIFKSFESSNISSLIIDLRYNGGGAVATAEYLADKIAPASVDGKLKYSYHVNNVLGTDWGWNKPDSSFGPVYFRKNGNLELSKVYFLVSSSTASASELLINTLEPYMPVYLIGREKTYGKPVGFFGLPMGKKSEVEIYVTSFQMFNANEFGDYFGGLALDKTASEDYLKDFGDAEEGLIAEALFHAKNGSFSVGIGGKQAISSKDLLRNKKSINIKNINSKASDLGMFKFKSDRLRLK